MLPRNKRKTKNFFSRLRDRLTCLKNRKRVVIENNLSPDRKNPELANKCANNNLTKIEVGNAESVIEKTENIVDIINEESGGEGVESNNLETETADKFDSDNEPEEEKRMLRKLCFTNFQIILSKNLILTGKNHLYKKIC